MSSLRRSIEELANQFTMNLLGALRGASLEELSSVAGIGRGRAGALKLAPRAPSGRLGRRSPAAIGQMVDTIVGLLAKNPKGLRAEQIREELSCQAKELPRPLADGIQAGRITKSGRKRATTYFAATVSNERPRAKGVTSAAIPTKAKKKRAS